jgi:hypothetical protein
MKLNGSVDMNQPPKEDKERGRRGDKEKGRCRDKEIGILRPLVPSSPSLLVSPSPCLHFPLPSLTVAAGVGYCERLKIKPTFREKSDEDNF